MRRICPPCLPVALASLGCATVYAASGRLFRDFWLTSELRLSRPDFLPMCSNAALALASFLAGLTACKLNRCSFKLA